MEVDVPLSGPGALYPSCGPGEVALMDSSEAEGAPDGQPDPGAALDCVRVAFWQAYRHLFPAHSLAAQTPQGAVVISWPVHDEPGAIYPYATRTQSSAAPGSSWPWGAPSASELSINATSPGPQFGYRAPGPLSGTSTSIKTSIQRGDARRACCRAM